jgi:cell division transport system ATP-binding protein
MDNNAGLSPQNDHSTTSVPVAGAQPRDDVVVRFDNVGMRYGRAPEVLTDLSFELPKGSFHFLTGASGAGKTSLLSLIYLANRPSRGLIELFGRQTSTLKRDALPAIRRRIGVAYEDIRLLDHLSAFDNVALPLRLARMPPKAWRKDVVELLEWFGLGERGHAMPATLSGGERKRLGLARAIVGRPELILADEPTAYVDPAMGARIMKLLMQLSRQGTTVLVATHDINFVADSGRPVLHLDDGCLTTYGAGMR